MTAQEQGMAGWFSDHLWALWGALALALACAEMLTLDLTLLMLASGALAGGLVALVVPGMLWVQVVVALGVAAAMLAFLRPTLLERVRRAPGYRSSLNKLVGSEGAATTAITRSSGEVKVNGELWSARLVPGLAPVEAGDLVEVYEVDGATLVVYPVAREVEGRPRAIGDE